MEEAKKVHVQGCGRDRISHLPNDVLETVLCFLPIRDAVRTSILSSKWRHHWRTLPRLVFDDDCDCGLSAKKFVVAIKSILSSHNGPITKFTLSISRLLCYLSEFDQEVLCDHLSRKHVEDLTLRSWLPCCLFSYAGLIHLDLTYCVFKLPPLFRGFKMLVTLRLEFVGLDADFLDIFIPSCPLLKELSLLHCTGVSHFNIEAPILQMFRLDCDENFDLIRFKNTPLLSSVAIYYRDDHVYDIDAEVFGISLPALEQLYIDQIFLQSIVAAVPPRFPTLFPHVTVLDVCEVRFSIMGDISRLLCLIRSSPNLRKLNIWAESTNYVENPVQDLGDEDYLGISFDQLQEASFYEVEDDLEIDFIGFVLAKASILRTLYVRPAVWTTVAERLKIMGKLNRLQRASSHAQVIHVETRYCN